MNGGHASRTIEETQSTGFHVAVRGQCGTLAADSEPPPSSGRAEAATLAYTDPYADTLEAHASFRSAHPDWCVDVETEMLTMTTFELWEALERGQVLARMRVWREGMECWTPIGDIAEFTWAIAGTPAPPSDASGQPEPTPEPRSAPPLREASPESSVRPTRVPRPWAHPDAPWLALGSAVAIVAVASAIAMSAGSPPARAADRRGAADVEAMLPAPAPIVERRPEPEATMRHGEPGQRRQPRDGRRTYGR